ncbi:hypothetical protein C3438_19350 [Bacillus velezensis]|uniref:hypothetical protein n=1 Tax=Bacillus velezensis TaxID=492670 RepID=UPI000CE0572E|nr:hypothetical protein [Bacillus velezensis]AVB11488.1 hypothetical protein C3438_19350 [Bacillus velezensis]MEC0383006.1 hypothetical protein [Bacillus velezensis]MEC0403163.1 hypothetical protein [Bacillus velezensis]QMI88298.1 hypothetical protein H1Q60_19655 [Bacillus velezensis]
MEDNVKPNQREMFLAKGIPYDELDAQMINLIDILNFKIGLKTRHCCFGHKPYEEIQVMFEEEVNLKEDQILELAELAGREWKGLQLSFSKWARFSPLMFNWSLVLSKRFRNPEDTNKYHYLRLVEEFFESYAAKK